VVRGLDFVAIIIPLDDVQIPELTRLVGLVYAAADATAQIPVITAKHDSIVLELNKALVIEALVILIVLPTSPGGEMARENGEPCFGLDPDAAPEKSSHGH
jgi:hypothetical protein